MFQNDLSTNFSSTFTQILPLVRYVQNVGCSSLRLANAQNLNGLRGYRGLRNHNVDYVDYVIAFTWVKFKIELKYFTQAKISFNPVQDEK